MAVVALGLLAVWLALTALRPVIASQRRYGTSAIRITPGAGRWIGALLVAANVVLACGPIGALFGLADIGGLDHLGWHVAGVVIGVATMVLVYVAQETMGSSWRIGVDPNERTGLVTEGVYRHVRNPIYTGMIGLGLSVILLVPDAVTILALVMFVVAVELQVRVVEEPYLRALHGSEYETWATSCGRFVPGVGRIG